MVVLTIGLLTYLAKIAASVYYYVSNLNYKAKFGLFALINNS